MVRSHVAREAEGHRPPLLRAAAASEAGRVQWRPGKARKLAVSRKNGPSAQRSPRWARREALREGSQALATRSTLSAARRAPAPRCDSDGRTTRAHRAARAIGRGCLTVWIGEWDEAVRLRRADAASPDVIGRPVFQSACGDAVLCCERFGILGPRMRGDDGWWWIG